MCHNVYLTESRDDGEALQLWRSPRVLRRGMGSIDLVAVFPLEKKTSCAIKQSMGQIAGEYTR